MKSLAGWREVFQEDLRMQDDILACLLFLLAAQSENIAAPLSTRDSPTLRPCRTPVHALT